MKQDERTPGRFWVENRDGRWQVQMEHRGPGSSFCVAQINHWADDGRALAEQIVNSLNAYTSTDALRSALAGLTEKTGHLVDAVQIENTASNYCKARALAAYECIKEARAALSGSPAPSTEGLREWQPIETAPKDGTWILGWAEGDANPARISWGRNHNCQLAWCTAFCSLVEGYITHWMPLPPAPDAARTALAGDTAPQEVDAK